MKTFTDQGIIFKQKNINEADKIISILTKYHGRIDAIAKGVRKTTSKKAGSIDLMTLSKFHVAEGKNLDIITEVELIDQFEDIKKKLKSTYTIFYICELLDKFFEVGENARKIFNELLNLLEALKNFDTTLPLRAFEMRLLVENGFMPNLETCLMCDVKFHKGEKRYLAFDQLGFYCNKERKVKGKIVADRTLKVLKFLNSATFEKLQKVKMDKDLVIKLQDLLIRWIEIAIEGELRSKRYL